MHFSTLLRPGLPLLLAAAPLAAQEQATLPINAAADVQDSDGNMIGTVYLTDQASGQALVLVSLNNLPDGTHAVHIHETGDCSADDFSSAGGHVAGDAKHGINYADGPHPGDLPNIVVIPGAPVNVSYFNPDLDIEGDVLDEDGAAFVVHSGPDDYVSQPAGDAGDRIACGVFARTVANDDAQ